MKFQPNEGKSDRIIRAVVGVAALFFGFYYLTGVLQIVAYVVGAVMLVTALTGFCGLYSLLHITTTKKK